MAQPAQRAVQHYVALRIAPRAAGLAGMAPRNVGAPVVDAYCGVDRSGGERIQKHERNGFLVLRVSVINTPAVGIVPQALLDLFPGYGAGKATEMWREVLLYLELDALRSCIPSLHSMCSLDGATWVPAWTVGEHPVCYSVFGK